MPEDLLQRYPSLCVFCSGGLEYKTVVPADCLRSVRAEEKKGGVEVGEQCVAVLMGAGVVMLDFEVSGR